MRPPALRLSKKRLCRFFESIAACGAHLLSAYSRQQVR